MNQHLITLCLGGGLFAILVFIHAFTDFVCQTHYEAMNKHNNAGIRAQHCLVYTIGFAPILGWLTYIGALSALEMFASVNILYWSHFYLDTYHLVYLWARYVRRPPEVCAKNGDGYYPNPKQGFVLFVSTTLGKLLMISIDQVSHFSFLFPIVWMALN